MVQLISYQSLGTGPKLDSRLIKVRFVVEKWHWDGSYPVSVISLMVHTDLHLGNTLTRKTCRWRRGMCKPWNSLSEIEEHWTKKSFHINFSMISYWKSFICNKHVTKGILLDKTDNRLSFADKSFIKLGLSHKIHDFYTTDMCYY